MTHIITTEELLKKPKKITFAKLRSMWLMSHKQQSYYRNVLLKAYSDRDTEILPILNKCIENETENQELIKSLMDKRF